MMKKKMIIEYDILTREVVIKENEFSTLEAFSILEEAIKMMIAHVWTHKDNDIEGGNMMMKAASFFCGNDMIVFIDGEIINELQGIYFIEDLKTADKPVKGYVTVVECKDEKSIREKLLNANEIRVEYVRGTDK